MKRNHDTTNRNYLGIWRNFNKFLVRLDKMPSTWEQRTILFCAYLIDKGMKSTTIKSHISAIKNVVQLDNYEWDDNQMLLTTLTRACKNINDAVFIRCPIRCNLLEIILFEVDRVLPGQFYLITMYRAFFALTYYGLFRVGELAKGDHPAKAKDVHIATNKKKILIVLHSSKMHAKDSLPQKIRISADGQITKKKIGTWFCPFDLAVNFIRIRGDYRSLQEQFFIFRDQSPLTAVQVHRVFKKILSNLNMDTQHFDLNSMRVG